MKAPSFVNPVVVVAVLASVARWQDRADGSEPSPGHHTFRKAKVVWRSCTVTTVKLKDLARWAAPILWFSPDEPLLEHREAADPLISDGRVRTSTSVPLPQVLPYDDRGEKG